MLSEVVEWCVAVLYIGRTGESWVGVFIFGKSLCTPIFSNGSSVLLPWILDEFTGYANEVSIHAPLYLGVSLAS